MSIMNTNFEDFYWHDATLELISIDRSNPGHQDVVNLRINWPDDTSSTIQFYDCYAYVANMNFGIVASESILEARYYTNSEELDSIRKVWASMGIDLEKLICYQITTNSTNSVIKVFALGFRIIDSGVVSALQK